MRKPTTWTGMSETDSQKRTAGSGGFSWLGSGFPNLLPWFASLGAAGLAITALYHISLDGQPLHGRMLMPVSGTFTVPLYLKIVLLGVAVIAGVFAVVVQRIKWGPVPFIGIVLGFLTSFGYALWMGLGAPSVQAQQVTQLASVSTAFFLIAIIVRIWNRHQSNTIAE